MCTCFCTIIFTILRFVWCIFGKYRVICKWVRCMNQEKIGKFIALLRKEKGLTQKELAQILQITDRAISKWENGRGLPELGMLLPLSEALGVSVNELLSGERLSEELYQQKLEENVVETIKYSNLHIQKNKKVFRRVIVAIGMILLVGFCLFVVDVNRMNHNQPVVFSTWGIDYFPLVNLNDEYLTLAIKDYLMNEESLSKKYENEHSFVSMHTYLIEEKEDRYYVYAWIVLENYYLDNNEIKLNSAYSIPHRFIVNENYLVLASDYPRDGIYYPIDMEELFPKQVRNDMDHFHYDGTCERMKLEIEEQVKLYFHQ